MSNVAKLKKKAAELELKKQFDKATAVYVELLELYDKHPDEIDVALFNRVGDLLIKQGNVADALDYYERAVDAYSDGGFFNNAIALCNKILRQSPGRASVYYKLGRISAQKGFKADAKQNFLEYADRMQQSGKMDEAFRALKEFADLVPDQDDIRQMLADQLTKLGRTQEALEQLHKLHDRYTSEGRTAEAAATEERMKAIDPSAAPVKRASGEHRQQSSGDLIFLDLDDSPRRPSAPVAAVPEPPAAPPPPSQRTTTPVPRESVGGLPIIDHGAAEELEVTAESTVEGLTTGGDFTLDTPAAEPLPGLETSSFDGGAAGGELLDLEPTSIDATPSSGGSLDFITPEPAAESAPAELPLMDLDAAPAAPAAESASESFELLDLDAPSPDADAPAETPIDTAVIPRASTMVAAQSVDILRAAAEGEPDNWSLRRELGEALLEAGHRDEGIRELEQAMALAEGANELDQAFSLAEEIGRLEPLVVRHHQKRVEFAFRLNDKPRLVDAYLALGDALTQAEQVDKARAVYQRVLDIAPDNVQAQAAIESFAVMQPPVEEAPAAAAPPPPMGKRPTSTMRRTGMIPTVPSTPPQGNDFVNLGDLLLDDEGPLDTRMVVEEKDPTGDEDADFQDMLRKFKQGIAQNVEEEDHQSHYDLGIAYKEMGLVDEAIAEFQKALRAPTGRIRTYEALGQCFMDKGQYAIGYTLLQRALGEQASDDQLVGCLYLLGYCAEQMGKRDEALTFYQRVFVVDITFRDVSDRLNAVEQAGR